MVYMLIQFNVKDYDQWKPFFEGFEQARRDSGAGDYQLFQGANNPNEVTILIQWDNVNNAQRFSQSQALRDVQQRAGVIGRPNVFFLNEDLD